jgi:hypothetical protein
MLNGNPQWHTKAATAYEVLSQLFNVQHTVADIYYKGRIVAKSPSVLVVFKVFIEYFFLRRCR